MIPNGGLIVLIAVEPVTRNTSPIRGVIVAADATGEPSTTLLTEPGIISVLLHLRDDRGWITDPTYQG
jgi:hypothetical protein